MNYNRYMTEREPEIPKNTLKRLEEALSSPEKGAEAALLTQSYHLFDGLKHLERCDHYQYEDEYEARGELFVVRISRIKEEEDGKRTVLVYGRTYNIDTDGKEVLDLGSQELLYTVIEGDVTTDVRLPNQLPKAELDDTNYEEIDAFIRRHTEEISQKNPS